MPAQIRLRTSQYRKFARLKGWKSEAQAAASIGVNEATLNRVLRGLTAPGERFIAGMLHALPEVEFADLFEVLGTEDAA